MSVCDKSVFNGQGSWFYFNQPINQIQGYAPNEPQILMHGPNRGLLWKNIVCSDVVNCAVIEDGVLVIKQSQILVIHDNGEISDCPDSPIPCTCPPCECCCSSSSS